MYLHHHSWNKIKGWRIEMNATNYTIVGSSSVNSSLLSLLLFLSFPVDGRISSISVWEYIHSVFTRTFFSFFLFALALLNRSESFGNFFSVHSFIHSFSSHELLFSCVCIVSLSLCIYAWHHIDNVTSIVCVNAQVTNVCTR